MLSPQTSPAAAGGGMRRDLRAASPSRGVGAMLLRCDLGAESYCLEGRRVVAIQRFDRLESDPGEGGRLGWLAGSERLPVYSLAARLGLETEPAPGPVVVVGGGGAPWGLMVERVARLPVAAGSRLDLPDLVRAATGGRFAGAVPLGERLALILAPERLRPEEDGGEDGDGADAAEASPPDPAAAQSEAVGSGPDADPSSPNGRRGAVVLFSTRPGGGQGATLFALSLGQVEEVLREAPVTPVPAASGAEAGLGLLGVTPWRDRVVAVIDLGLRLGLGPSTAEPGGRLLVARGVRHPGWLALPVRADLHVEPLPLPSRAWVGGPRLSPLAALGVFELAAGTVVVPDVDRILTPDRVGPQPGPAARSAPDERGESDEES